MPKKRILSISLMLAAGLLFIPLAESGYFFIKGLRALRQGFEGKSARYLEKSIKANPHFPESYVLLALAYAEWGSSSRHYMEYDEKGLIKLKSETLGKAESILKTALMVAFNVLLLSEKTLSIMPLSISGSSLRTIFSRLSSMPVW